MSVEASAIALHHTRTTNPTYKLVLTGIANHHGDGGSWPSIATLAKYALCSERTAQRAINELEALGEIQVEAQAGGTRDWRSDRRPNLYHFLLRCPVDCDRSARHNPVEQAGEAAHHGVTPTSPRDSRRGDTGDVDGVTPVTERGDKAVSPKPSLEPSMEGGGAATPPATPAASVNAAQKRAHRLPENWIPPTAVVDQMRRECPAIDQDLELLKFRDFWESVGGAKGCKLDWTKTYRNWIRNSIPPRGQAGPQPGYRQTPEQLRQERLARAGDLTPPGRLAGDPAAERAWLREARRRIADGLPFDDIGDAA